MNAQENRRPVIRCPACRQNLSHDAGDPHQARCAGCGECYPVRDGVIDLLPGSTGKRSFSQACMEWPPIIRIYESRYWRRNPMFALRTGITFEREYELVTEAARLSGNEFFLDLACGPGIYTRPIARRLERGHAAGLDLSLPMLRFLSGKASAEGIGNISLIHGSALDLPFEDNAFDWVNCCGALHLMPDVERALSEVNRVLIPGGCFTSAVLGRPSGGLARKIADIYGRRLGVNPFAPEGFESLLKLAGFSGLEYLHKKEGWGWLVVRAAKAD